MLIDGVDYGPLSQLLGKWIGTRGLDTAPEPDRTKHTSFIDELVFMPSGPTINADKQQLVTVSYRHSVRKKEDGNIFHDQIGHWLYEPATGLLMHSLSIPRGVCLLAGGCIKQEKEENIFSVRADSTSDSFTIAQSPFMLEKAFTRSFEMTMSVTDNKITYKQVTQLYIYDKNFEHVDKSTLKKVLYDID